MEAGQGLAIDAGKQILQSGDIYAPIAVLLGLALIGLLFWHFKETGRLNKELLATERQHGKDALQMQSSVQTALATVQQAIAIITAKGGS
jgi:hypothetical protein